MSTEVVSLKGLLNQDQVKAKFSAILKENAESFTANLAVMVSNSEALRVCEPISIVSAAVVSASLKLPLDPNLGMAAIVPFKNKDGVTSAQFQLMYKGLIQLCVRSGQYENIGVTEITEGQLIDENPLTGEYKFDFSIKGGKVIGYAAYFSLLNGFKKALYWPIEKIEAHGKRFSKTYSRGFGLWKDDFDSMAKKTVLKALLNTWGIKSIEMQSAIKYDQAMIKDIEGDSIEYVDNEPSKSFDESEVLEVKIVGSNAK